jgi:uncharacterized protein YjbI with pentapeptide repeats
LLLNNRRVQNAAAEHQDGGNMSRQQRWMAWAFIFVAAFHSATARAAIYRWDNGQVIPGTEAVVLGPGVSLSGRELEFAALGRFDLTGAYFRSTNLRHAAFVNTILTNADLTDANVTGAIFWGAKHFTKEQLYSTASYQSRNLQGIRLSSGVDHADLSGWNFSGQDLTKADLGGSTLTSADFTDAVVTGTYLYDTTSRGFTKEQLYATASYKARDLRGILLGSNDLSGWDFRGQNLTGAGLGFKLTNADLTGAVVVDVGFGGFGGMYSDLTKDQLYSTASYQAIYTASG